MAQVSTTVEGPPESPGQRVPRGLESILVFLSRYREVSILVVAIVLVAFFQIRNTTFLTSSEMSVVLRDTGRIGMIAAAMVMVMITGEIDLSVGATFALAPYVMIMLTNVNGFSLWLAGLVAILIGVAVGVVNGVVTTKFHIPSLITTLGTFFLINGITISIGNSQPLENPSQEPFNKIFGENLYGPLNSFWSWVTITGYSPFLWALAVTLVLTLVLFRTRFGLHTIATGSNLLAAREIGVRSDRIKIYNFMITGSAAAFAGVINTMQYGSADPLGGGPTLTLQAIAAAVIGGTSLFGGVGTAIGALIGAFVVASLTNGLILLGAQATQSDIYLGAAIIAAMILSVWISRARERRRP
jgi:simple sugar transport system permease protein